MGAVEQTDWLRTIPGDVFERYEKTMVPALFDPWARRLVEAADLQAGERVLDLACGTGIVARHAAERVGADGAVTGVDLLPGMLDVARRVGSGSRTPIEWVHADAAQLPLPDASFDAVLCQQGLQFFPDKEAALSEARRVLRPGGRILLSTWCAIDRCSGFASVQAALERHAPQAATFLPQAFALGDAEELRGWLSKAGFAAVEVAAEAAPVRFPSHERFLSDYLGAAPIAPAIVALPDDRRAALAQDIAASIERYVDGEGVRLPTETLVGTARRAR